MRNFRPRAFLLLTALALASCGRKVLPPGVIAEGAILVDVAPAQDFLIYVTSPPAQGSSGWDVWAAPLPSGDPLQLQAGAPFPPNLAGETVSGESWIWTPRMAAPWSLGSTITNADLTRDGRTLVFFDGALTNLLEPGKIELVHVDECAGASCNPVSILDGVPLSIPRASDDGRFVGVTGLRDGQQAITLIEMATGKQTILARASNGDDVKTAEFSPDGSLVAVTVSTLGPGASSTLQLFSTATALPVPYAPLPAGYAWGDPQFLADNSIFVFVEASDDKSWVAYHLTPTAATALASGTGTPNGYFVGDRDLFIEDDDLLAPGPLSVASLAAPSAPPVVLSTASFGIAALDAALTRIAFFEGVDDMTFQGTLVLSSLPDGHRLASFDAIAQFGTLGGSAIAFTDGSDGLLYIDGVPPQGQGGTLHLWRGGVDRIVRDGVSNFQTRRSPDTLYTTVTGTSSGIGPLLTGEIHQEPLH